ncbi:hypothetical protein CALVIDRAFT_80805 [Calocera viscosa TUFC12733]|uniref:F-box domain-containing protein n=1 Tax=Calocera viscosa (strain TUFC12733) TaxID=1330018 RepID=A0A167N146_CALVF|nr:hypothetical protein CALVIDRAFT_80805 [Calocera viscosa TUFC12733]
MDPFFSASSSGFAMFPRSGPTTPAPPRTGTSTDWRLPSLPLPPPAPRDPPTLPPELLDHILSFVPSHSTLRHLSLSSRALRDLAHRHLYRSLYFGPPKKTAQICRAILRTPALAAHVHSIEFALYHDLPSMASDNAFRTVLYPGYMRLVFRAFRGMHRLKLLRFCGQDGRLRIFANLDQCPFELETLLLLTVGPCEPDFLLHQPRVAQLKIAALMSGDSVLNATGLSSPEVFPALRELTTSWAVALKLVPHRPVEKLAVIDFVTNAALQQGLPLIAQSSATSSLRYLEITVLEVSLELLGLLAASLPGMTTLVIRERRSGTVGLSIEAAHNPDMVFPRFRSLQTLKLFKLLLPEKLSFPDRGWNAMVHRMGQASPALRCIALGVVSAGDGQEPYGTLYYERRRVKSAGSVLQAGNILATSSGTGNGKEREVPDIWDIKVRDRISRMRVGDGRRDEYGGWIGAGRLGGFRWVTARCWPAEMGDDGAAAERGTVCGQGGADGSAANSGQAGRSAVVKRASDSRHAAFLSSRRDWRRQAHEVGR